VPSAKIVTERVSIGTCTFGSSGKPWLLTTLPSRSSWKVPSRVYSVSPPGRWIWKKPSPSTAMSRSRPVLSSWPWPWILAMAPSFTP
jgi:hypothetical protein